MGDSKRSVLLILLAAAVLQTRNAYAYLDPGTGSLLLQAIITGFLGAVFAIKVFWHRIKDFASGLFSRSDSHEEAGD